jgi:hypothetical protein
MRNKFLWFINYLLYCSVRAAQNGLKQNKADLSKEWKETPESWKSKETTG